MRLWMGAAALALAGCAATVVDDPRVLSAEDSARLRQAGAEVLFWSQAERDANFRTMPALFPTVPIRAGGTPRPLPPGPPLALDPSAIDAFVAQQNIAALLVLVDGRLRLEHYARGLGAQDRWTSFSVAKSLTSTLVGAAISDGHIGALSDPVTRYVPELAGTAYDGVTVGQVLTMTSGVAWNEDYTDPASDVALMYAEAPPAGMDATVAYVRTLGRAAPPGTRWNYNTSETNLIGVIVSRAVGRPLADYASEKLWRAYGMEADAFWQIDAGGHETAGCCFSAVPRDYARIGQFMLDGGQAGGAAILPAGWVAEATRSQVDYGVPGRGYGYQWWTRDGGYAAIGIFGQAIMVDPRRRVVMVTLAAWPRATDRTLSAAREAFFAEVVGSLAGD